MRRALRTAGLVAASLAVASLLLAGCALVPATPPGDDTEGGPGLPVQRPDRPIVGERQAFSGQVAVQGNGCLHAALDDGRVPFVIWPAGTVPATGESGDAIVVGDRSYADGDPFRGTGAMVPPGNLPDPVYWREAHLLFCDPEANAVLVLDAIDVP